jgi:hypothetical protein
MLNKEADLLGGGSIFSPRGSIDPTTTSNVRMKYEYEVYSRQMFSAV